MNVPTQLSGSKVSEDEGAGDDAQLAVEKMQDAEVRLYSPGNTGTVVLQEVGGRGA